MRIRIESKNLIDFPYDAKKLQYHQLFFFDEQKIENLISELVYASPTCYLISGYRGSGKTSFIRRVEQLSQERNPQLLFVHSSFSRYESQTLFLRKIIRDLQETVLHHAKDLNGNVSGKVDSLYRRTFYKVTEERINTEQTEKGVTASIEGKNLLGKIVQALAPLLLPAAIEIVTAFVRETQAWRYMPLLKAAASFISVGWTIANGIKLSISYSYKKTAIENVLEATIDDDNITEYILEQIIEEFGNEGYKLVFVLDELDKVDDEEQARLFNEMKPWLVRGKADFIVVAGQKLTMRYYHLKEKDDEVLASMFSKIIHVGLLQEQYFRKLFTDFLWVKETAPLSFQEELQILQLCDSYIYRAKRLPRSFMNLIRQDLQWEKGQAYLETDDRPVELEALKMVVLNKLSIQYNVRADIPETLRGHLMMYLFRTATLISVKGMFMYFDSDLWNMSQNPDGLKETPNYPYPQLLKILENSVSDFYRMAIDEQLMVAPPDPGSKVAIGNKASGENEDSADDDKLTKEREKQTQLETFKADFNALANLMLNYVLKLFPSSPELSDKRLPLQQFFTVYHNKGVFNFPLQDSEPLQQEMDFYTSRSGQTSAFEPLHDLFQQANISVLSLIESLSLYFLKDAINKSFNVLPITAEDMKLVSAPPAIKYMIGVSKDLLLVQHGQGDKEVFIWFDFKFINAAISISPEELNRVITAVDGINIGTGRGNYYIPVIIFKSTSHVDSRQLRVSTSYSIERARPDLKNRISYIIESVYTLQEIASRLDIIRDAAIPYNIVPQLKSKERPPSKKLRKTIQQEPPNRPIIDPDDPQKGRWGGHAKVSRRRLSARVTPIENETDLFNVYLKVESIDRDFPLTGQVTFYLHDSFSPDKITIPVVEGVAELSDLTAYEAFTVGASCDNNTVHLELDLNTIADLPKGFIY